MTDELDEMLKAELSEEPEAAEVATEEPEVEEQEKGEEEAATPAEPDPVSGLKAGISAERQKRQEAEFRAQMLERQLMQYQQPREQQQKPGFWDDPEGYLGSMQSSMQQAMQQQQLNMSEFYARREHPDFDDKLSVFADLAKSDPALIQQMTRSPNPAEFAYQTASKHITMQEIGDINSLKDRIRAEVRAELEAEKAAEIEKAIQQRDKIPGSFSQTRATGGGKSPEWTGPPSLDQILGH